MLMMNGSDDLRNETKHSDSEKMLYNEILEDLKRSGDCFGLKYLQIKYNLGYVKAVRILEFIIHHHRIEEGNFGSAHTKAPDGAEYECVPKYRLL